MEFLIYLSIAVIFFVITYKTLTMKPERSDWMQGIIDAQGLGYEDKPARAMYNVGVVSYHTNVQMRKNIELAKQYKNKAVICAANN